jgi:hypothetical protein
MLRTFSPPMMESTVTARLSAAGGVLFAKTNMDEFGMGSANVNSAYGACVNPWMARNGSEGEEETEEGGPRVAGGSSGGSATAVASGAAIAAVGSDTGGSAGVVGGGESTSCQCSHYKPQFALMYPPPQPLPDLLMGNNRVNTYLKS